MKKHPFHRIIPFAMLAAMMCPAMANESTTQPAAIPANAGRGLKTKGAKIVQVRDYQMGPGNTQVFIIIAEQNAVVHLWIDHTTRNFATIGKVILFAPGTTEDSISGWINNQHSCGLLPDVPEPVYTGKLPDGTCTVTERKKVGEFASPTDNTPFHDYQLKVAVKAHTETGKFTLEAFETDAKAYLKVATL